MSNSNDRDLIFFSKVNNAERETTLKGKRCVKQRRVREEK